MEAILSKKIPVGRCCFFAFGSLGSSAYTAHIFLVTWILECLKAALESIYGE